MSDVFNDKNFGADSEMSSMTIDWGKPGDFIAGTFIKARHGIKTKHGTNSIYELLAEKGSYHTLIGEGRLAKPSEKPDIIAKGEVCSIWGRSELFNGQMNSLRPGQVVKIVFDSEPVGANGPWKKLSVFAPKDSSGAPLMNKEWVEANTVVSAATDGFGDFDEKKK